MSAWMDSLADVDDDYLIGLSNKGIVKRAYKDKGEVAARIGEPGETVSVEIGEETVTVCFPLGESKCTCPSRSICRHIVQAILVLKEQCGQEKAADSGEKQDGGRGDENGKAPGDGEQGAEAGKAPVWEEICAYPVAKLKKILGIRGFQLFVNQTAAGIRPGIQSTSVVTVNLPEKGVSVKLLSPLEYSTCTCHKKDICVHKAAAILWCQLEAGVLTKESLLGEMAEVQNYDMDSVREAAGQMRAFLEELFATGLSRTSPDILDYLERLAIVSHNEGLARFEGYFRALSDSYDRYFARKAAFRTEDLMARMARLYRRVEGLVKAEDAGAVAGLAGEFRADYLPVGNLDLIGIAMEHFQSQNGYEGETVYFLEENTKKWYTYTNARPVFYDNRTRRGYMEKAQSPWGLNLSLENLLKVRIHLTGAKCDDRNRLSSSQDTKGEVVGEQKLCVSDVQNWYYRDFGELFSGQIDKQQSGWLAEQSGMPGEDRQAGEEGGETSRGTELVFVQPAECGKSEFSQTGQILTLPLYDRAGREILVEVTYSKEESGTIRYLERISQKKVPCFLGKVSLRNGRIRMYPVDLPEIEEPMEETERQGAKDGTGEEDLQAEERIVMGRKSAFDVMEDLTEEIMSLMEDLYQSGFDTVHDSTLKDIRKASELTEQYGMAWLSQMLASLAGEIEAGRHSMERKTADMAGLYTDISEYLYLCGQKTAYDRGRKYYKG